MPCRKRPGFNVIVITSRKAVARHIIKAVTLMRACDARHWRIAQSCGRLDQGRQDRLQIESRAADHLEHVGGRRLLLQRFPKLVEQARILDGDDGLFREIAYQLDLLVGERPHLLAIDADHAYHLTSAEHRHAEQCSYAGYLDDDNCQRVTIEITSFLPIIDDVNRLASLRDAGQWYPRSRPEQHTLMVLLCWQVAMQRCQSKGVA